jgi:integration host factor subunit alpha
MTKSEIVSAVYAKVGGFSKKEAADIVEIAFETVKETLGHGEKIKISGFGNFVLRDKRQRRGRNPQTGQPLTITERRVLTFKASQILKSILNPEDGHRSDGATAAANIDTTADQHGHPSGGSPSAVPASARATSRATAGQSERR